MLFGDARQFTSVRPNVVINPASDGIMALTIPIVFDGTNFRAVENSDIIMLSNSLTLAAGAGSNEVAAQPAIRYVVLGASLISKVSPVTCITLSDNTNNLVDIAGNSGYHSFPYGLIWPVNTPIRVVNPTGFAAIAAERVTIHYIQI